MYQEDTVILNIYVLIIKPGGKKAKTGITPKKNRQMYSIGGDLNILLSINDRQKIRKVRLLEQYQKT